MSCELYIATPARVVAEIPATAANGRNPQAITAGNKTTYAPAAVAMAEPMIRKTTPTKVMSSRRRMYVTTRNTNEQSTQMAPSLVNQVSSFFDVINQFCPALLFHFVLGLGDFTLNTAKTRTVEKTV
jgi:hypothetical protein